MDTVYRDGRIQSIETDGYVNSTQNGNPVGHYESWEIEQSRNKVDRDGWVVTRGVHLSFIGRSHTYLDTCATIPLVSKPNIGLWCADHHIII